MNTAKEVRKNYPLLITEEGRQCTECNKFKSWSEFYKQHTHKTGHKARCKACHPTNRPMTISEILESEYKTHPLIKSFVVERFHLNDCKAA